MEKKEKIFIVVVTLIILVCIFFAFIVSNSQKVPPMVTIQNIEKKSASAILGGYEWKAFGNIETTDSINLAEANYSIDNTIVSKTGETLTLSTTEKFTVENIEYVSNVSNESFDTSAKSSETGEYFTVLAPEIEGTYLCLFDLKFYDKGSAEYGVKIVVTDDNIYDVESIVDFKNTNVADIVRVKELLSKLPYSKELSGVMIDNVSKTDTLIVKYDNVAIEKEDLLNNTVALFALIPDLDSVIYEVGRDEIDLYESLIYYSRDEINNLISRDVLEYAEDIELWTKEIIYEEKSAYNDEITFYTSTIITTLAKLSDKELGKYVAIDIIQNNVSGDEEESNVSISLDEYDIKTLLREIGKEYELVLSVDSSKFENKEGTLVKLEMIKDIDNQYLLEVSLTTFNGKILEEAFRVEEIDGVISIIENDEAENSKSGE